LFYFPELFPPLLPDDFWSVDLDAPALPVSSFEDDLEDDLSFPESFVPVIFSVVKK